jgi:DNA-directed RNA polymerase subunit RPC12/RpoP
VQSMNGAAILCSACSSPLPPAVRSSDDGGDCPACNRRVWVKVFPALTHAKVNGRAEMLATQSEASCFFHEQNRAERPCDECGRFLCKLCEIEIPSRILCPACFDKSVRERTIQQLESSRTMHDSIALSLAIIPTLLIWPVIVSAPMSLYWTIRHWNAPRSVVPRTRVRYYFAASIALTQIALIAFIIFELVMIRR